MMSTRKLLLFSLLITSAFADDYARNLLDDDVSFAWLREVKGFHNYEEFYKAVANLYASSELVYMGNTSATSRFHKECVRFVEPKMFDSVSCVLPDICADSMHKVLDEGILGVRLYMCYAPLKSERKDVLPVYKLKLRPPERLDNVQAYALPPLRVLIDYDRDLFEDASGSPASLKEKYRFVLYSLDSDNTVEDYRFVKFPDGTYSPIPSVCSVIHPDINPDVQAKDFEVVQRGDKACIRTPSPLFSLHCSIDYWKRLVDVHFDEVYEAAMVIDLYAKLGYLDRIKNYIEDPVGNGMMIEYGEIFVKEKLALPIQTTPYKYRDSDCKRKDRLYLGKTPNGAKFADICPIQPRYVPSSGDGPVEGPRYDLGHEPGLKLIRRVGADFSPFTDVEECVTISYSSTNLFVSLVNRLITGMERVTFKVVDAVFSKLLDVLEPLFRMVITLVGKLVSELLIRLLAIKPAAELILSYVISYYYFRDHFISLTATVVSLAGLLSIYHIFEN